MKTLFTSLIVLLFATIVHGQTLVSQENWSLHYVDSEAPYSTTAAINAFDGDPSTRWYTEFSADDGPLPHEIAIALNETVVLTALDYLPQQDHTDDRGRVKHYEVYTSMDGESWGAAVASGMFPFNINKQSVTFNEPVTARYIKVVALSAYFGPWAAVAEINVFASDDLPPPPPPGELITMHFTFTEPTGNVDGSALNDLTACTIRWSMDGNLQPDEVLLASAPTGAGVQNRSVVTSFDLSVDRVVDASAFCEDVAGNKAVPLGLDTPFLVTRDAAPESFSSVTVTLTFD